MSDCIVGENCYRKGKLRWCYSFNKGDQRGYMTENLELLNKVSKEVMLVFVHYVSASRSLVTGSLYKSL